MHCPRTPARIVPVSEVGEIGFAAAAVEPVSVETARSYTHSAEEDDAELERTIKAARVACENYTGRTYAKRTLELRWAELGRVLNVARGPIGSVTEFGYVNTAGAEVLFAAGSYSLEGQMAHSTMIRFRESFAQPSDIATDRSSPIFLRGVFGPDMDTVGPLPADVVQALLWTAVHYFENRSPVVTGTIATELPNGIQNILRPYRQNPI